jgi:hypothetical protein
MNKSESIKNLAAALAQAQGEMPAVKMNAQNPFLKNRYADLGAVIETSRPILAKHQLSISQFPTSEGERIGITSILMHSSGEWVSDTVYIPITDSKGLSIAQSSGVVFSYLRRYSWAAILGLYADEDTDGHASKTETKPTGKPEAVRVEQTAGVSVTASWVVNNYQLNSKDDKGKLLEAGKILNMLGLVNKPVEIAKQKIDLYKAWRKTLEPQDAAAKVLAGEVPQEAE